jgi:hypothetical protein
MGLLQLSYLFPHEPPAYETLVERLACLAGEIMQLEDGQLTCPAMDDYLWLRPVEQGGQRSYVITTLALGDSYLLDAFITVLQTAGGGGPAPRHDIAGRSWQQTQALYTAWLT